MLLAAIFVFSLGFCGSSRAATPAQWRGRSIYQVFTDRFARTDISTSAPCASGFEGYCGGTWKGITSKLDYIQGMGFTAIWISPIVQQVSDATRGYHGYSAKNINALNNNFGTAADLVALANALHSRSMYLMVDVVANHMAYEGTANTINYGSMSPFNTASYFHSTCWIDDYNNQTDVERCWLGNNAFPLPDLNTTQAVVQDTFTSWVKNLVSTYSIDGLRVDTVKHVQQSFWPIFNSASGVFNVGEVADATVDYVCPYQNYMDGVLTYPTYYSATAFFSNPSATSASFVSEVQAMNDQCKDTTLLGSFSENHDVARFANSTSDITLAKNIMTFSMLTDGIPIIYQGQEQHFSGGADPYDREALWLSSYSTSSTLYQLVKSLNAIRSMALAKSSDYLTWHTQVVYSDDHNVAFRKGDASYMTLMVLSNLGQAALNYSVQMSNVGFPAGLTVVELLSCATAVVGADGSLVVNYVAGLPMVYYPQFLLSGTGWCGN
ncbi:Alpha-amylase, partial [Lachnellula suecica]